MSFLKEVKSREYSLTPEFIKLQETVIAKFEIKNGGDCGIAQVETKKAINRELRLEKTQDLEEEGIFCCIFEEGVNCDSGFQDPNHSWIEVMDSGEVMEIKTDLPRNFLPSGRIRQIPRRLSNDEILNLSNLLSEGKVKDPLEPQASPAKIYPLFSKGYIKQV